MDTKTLDSLEELLITNTLTTARQLKEGTDIKMTDREVARQLIGKIGARIVFGKEVFDKVVNKKN